jgi:tetratricopeptide (TPR) repeat protein
VEDAVFINYRGEDSHSYGALLYTELARQFGTEHVFLDAESIPPGTDFVEELLQRVRSARLLLAVIGPRWLTATDPTGRRRIDDPADWIRRELVEAFTAGVRVIPVLADQAELPREAELPADIAGLSRCQYRHLRRREPTADLARIVADLTSMDPLLAAAARSLIGAPRQLSVPHQLPPDAVHFTGRSPELDALDALLSTGTSGPSAAVVISAIAGAAGMGKTALAVRWAYRNRDRFPDGELYVNLRGFDTGPPKSPEQALDEFLRALNVPTRAIPTDRDALATTYRSLLAERRMLIVLDNAATADQVRPLMPGSATCMVLITSRNRLSGLVARDGAHRITLDVLPATEAIALLRNTIGERAEHQPEATAELARKCAYLPLALRIAAERAVGRPHHGVGDLVAELTDARARLDVLAAAEDDEATAVRSVFYWSYRTLPDPAARVFRLLGLHPGPDISLDAIVALTGAAPSEARRQVDVLVSLHLLTEVDRERFSFHDLVRDYAAELAATREHAADREVAIRRLYEWYLHTAYAALYAYFPQHPEIPISPVGSDYRPLAFNDRDQALDWFVAEHANLMAVIRSAPEVGQHTVGWQLPNAVDAYLGQCYHVADRIMVHQLGLAVAQRFGEPVGEVWAYAHLGEVYHDGAMRHDEAIVCFQHALRTARGIGYKFGEAISLGNLATMLTHSGRYEEAIDLSRQALDLYRALGQRRNQGLSLLNLGDAFLGLGDFDQAIDHLHLAWRMFDTIGLAVTQALTLRSIARVHGGRGQFEDAANDLRQAAAIYEQTNITRWRAETLAELGVVLGDLGQSHEARDVWRKALEIFEELGHPQAVEVRAHLDALDP